MKKRNNFTLVEMLTVVAIIGILAGLVIPTVIIAKNRGQVTQAKTDISNIMTALKQVKTDYSRMLIKEGSDYYTGGVKADTETFSCSGEHSGSHTVAKLTGDSYDALIAELSVPKNKTLRDLTAAKKRQCTNKRKKVYLDPKNGFDPTADYTTAANKEKLYRDPWGNAYIVYIGVETAHELKMEANSSVVAGDVAIYSYGPNGTDDGGCNVELDSCISNVSGNGSDNHKNHDDIASWNL